MCETRVKDIAGDLLSLIGSNISKPKWYQQRGLASSYQILLSGYSERTAYRQGRKDRLRRKRHCHMWSSVKDLLESICHHAPSRPWKSKCMFLHCITTFRHTVPQYRGLASSWTQKVAHNWKYRLDNENQKTWNGRGLLLLWATETAGYCSRCWQGYRSWGCR